MGDQDSRRKKGAYGMLKPSRNIRHEPLRRDLNSYTLKPPKYTIENEYLENGVEYELKFAGVIKNFPLEVDITNRTDVLSIIDMAKRQKVIPLYLGLEHDSVFRLSMEDIKISRRDPPEILQLNIPIAEIAAICYIREDGLHILSIKHGSPEFCDLAVVYCESQELAEGICAIFQVVFTEAVMKLLVKLFDKALDGPIAPSSGVQSVTNGNSFSPFGQIDQTPPSRPRAIRTVGSTVSSASQTNDLLLRDYMQQLREKLKPWELKHFAALLNSNNEMPFAEYCEKIFNLYGPDRKYLLSGLRPFIYDKDADNFDDFLRKKGIIVTESVHGSLSSFPSFQGNYERSSSEVSTGSNIANGSLSEAPVEDWNNVLDNITAHMVEIDASVKMSPGHTGIHLK